MKVNVSKILKNRREKKARSYASVIPPKPDYVSPPLIRKGNFFTESVDELLNDIQNEIDTLDEIMEVVDEEIKYHGFIQNIPGKIKNYDKTIYHAAPGEKKYNVNDIIENQGKSYYVREVTVDRNYYNTDNKQVLLPMYIVSEACPKCKSPLYYGIVMKNEGFFCSHDFCEHGYVPVRWKE